MRLASSLMVLAFFAGGSRVTAQEVSGGVKVGVSFATLSDDSSQDVDLDSRTGLVAGGFMTWPIGESTSACNSRGCTRRKGRPSTRWASRVRPSWTTSRSRCCSCGQRPPRARAERLSVLWRPVSRLQSQLEGLRRVQGEIGGCRYSRRGHQSRRSGRGHRRGRRVRPLHG